MAQAGATALAAQALTAVLLLALAVSYQTVSYFAVLLLAMHHCYCQPVGRGRKGLSALCVAVTWFYIVRFMATYSGPMGAFDAAYADVIWGGRSGNWGHTQTLLTWAVVAAVWSAEASMFVNLFGVFGAMSGSYLLFTPSPKPPARVPFLYAVASVLAFLCIAMLPLASTASTLSWWLWGLHVCLLAPKLLRLKPEVDRCSLYVLLALLAAAIHVSAGLSPWPTTDCRISITIDAVVCAGITLAFVLERAGSSGAAAAWGLLMPVLSPGAVLGLFCACELGLSARLVTAMQEWGAKRARMRTAASDADSKWKSGTWMNLGYWKETEHYDTACQQLAALVGDAVELQPDDRVLSVACGYGDELNFFQMKYGVKQVTGLDANASAVACFKPGAPGSKLVHGDVVDLARGRHIFRHGQFDKVLAVDGIYHCGKAAFLEDCARLLPAGGALAMTDVVLAPGAPAWLRALLPLMGVRAANHWTKAEYADRLAAAGLTMTRCESLEPFVLASWLPKAMTQHLDYVLVSARLEKAPSRPTAAVVGSGLSGLVAAHLLGRTHDVTVFESRPVPGFAGMEAKLPSGVAVDIPLRMIEPHYWRSLVAFCGELGVPLVETQFTVSIYGEGGAVLKTDRSLFQSVFGNLAHYARILMSAIRLGFTSSKPGETLLEFVTRVGLADTDFYQIYVRRHLSWVLSCPYELVDKYPANLVLDFFGAIQGNYGRRGSPTMRIDPSVRRLEEALLAGQSVRTGQPVQPFLEGRTVDGTAFDVVVIATEANAVPKLLPRPWASLFQEFRYHPSHVFVHRDPALMPADRADWRAVNVRDDNEGVACEITVWVNAFYGSMDLGGDVFETVNACHAPAADLVVREVHLQRVVHDVHSAGLQAAIEELQGRDGFYFCGAYSVPGMGLLEQACRSAHKAVEAVQRDLGAQQRLG